MENPTQKSPKSVKNRTEKPTDGRFPNKSAQQNPHSVTQADISFAEGKAVPDPGIKKSAQPQKIL